MNRRAGHRRWRSWERVLLPLLIAVGWVIASTGAPYETLEYASLDWRFQLRGAVTPSPSVAVVLIDEATASAAGGWPLPERTLADGIRAIRDLGAQVVGFDLLLSDQDHYGAPRSRPDLAEAIAASGNVAMSYAFLFDDAAETPGAATRAKAELAQAAFRLVSVPPGMAVSLPPPAGLLPPDPDLCAAAATLGHVTVALDRDGGLRRHLPVLAFDGQYYPSLPVELARLHLGVPRGDIVLSLGEGMTLGDRFVPMGTDMRVPVNYYGPPGTLPTYSLLDVMENRVAADALAGRTVVLGARLPGLGDRFRTPFGQMMSGAEYMATVTGNLVDGAWLVRNDRLRAATAVMCLLLAVGVGQAWRFPPVPAVVITGAAILGWIVLTVFALGRYGIWLDLIGPAGAALTMGSVAGMQTLCRERGVRREAERVRGNLARHFPPEIAEQLARQDAIDGFDKVVRATIMFVDLAGFTTLSEGRSPSESMALLRLFHGRVEAIVFRHRGVIDQYIGDGALACFGVLSGAVDAASRAVACAHELIAELDGHPLEEGGQPMHLRIGLHTGSVIAGNLGGDKRFQFTVIGDTVNVASRLEALSGSMGVRIVVSEPTLAEAVAVRGSTAADGFEWLGPVDLRGRDMPITVAVLR